MGNILIFSPGEAAQLGGGDYKSAHRHRPVMDTIVHKGDSRRGAESVTPLRLNGERMFIPDAFVSDCHSSETSQWTVSWGRGYCALNAAVD